MRHLHLKYYGMSLLCHQPIKQGQLNKMFKRSTCYLVLCGNEPSLTDNKTHTEQKKVLTSSHT